MGVVYRARDTRLGRFVALKVVGERDHVPQTARQRLLREAQTASSLNHPRISTIYEAGEVEKPLKKTGENNQREFGEEAQ